jgi:hypothetical protein
MGPGKNPGLPRSAVNDRMVLDFDRRHRAVRLPDKGPAETRTRQAMPEIRFASAKRMNCVIGHGLACFRSSIASLRWPGFGSRDQKPARCLKNGTPGNDE